MNRVIKFALAIMFVASPVASHATAEPPARDHELVAEDYFSLAVIGSIAVSFDGQTIAYTESRWDEPSDKRNTDLWTVGTKEAAPTRITFDPAGDSSPTWSPDGTWIYFASGRKRGDDESVPYDGKRQIWRVRASGGAPTPVTRIKGGVGLFELAQDGNALYYTTGNEVTDDDWKDLRTEFKDLNYGHGVTEFGQVWRLDLQSWRTEKLVDEKRVINSMKISPDQQRIAMLTTPQEELISNEGWSRIDVYDARTKKTSTITEDGWRKNHPSPFGWLDAVAWSADGNALVFTISFDGYPPHLYNAQWNGDDVSLHDLHRPDVVTITGGTAKWRGKSHDICFRGEDHARSRVYCISDVRGGKQGKTTILTPGDVTVSSFSFTSNGKELYIVTSTLTDPPNIYHVSASGKYNKLTNANPQVETWKLPQISLVQWKGANGDEVEGILELPPDYVMGSGPLPMVVEIHGGPTAASLFQFRFWIYGRALLAAKGYAVLSPNYRGSTGYGDKFLVDLIGRENDIEVEDILLGVDAMVARGIADADRLGVMGWSNGGFLTNCLITQTDRFKAASSGAGVLDQVMQWGVEDTPGHVINYMNGTLPWANPEEYQKGSPLYNLDKVRTPTVIHVGENDPRVPAEHSKTLYRALRHYLDIPVELVIYPDEGHGLTTYTHRKAKMEWDHAWFDRYLLGKTTDKSTSEDSAQ